MIALGVLRVFAGTEPAPDMLFFSDRLCSLQVFGFRLPIKGAAVQGSNADQRKHFLTHVLIQVPGGLSVTYLRMRAAEDTDFDLSGTAWLA